MLSLKIRPSSAQSHKTEPAKLSRPTSPSYLHLSSACSSLAEPYVNQVEGAEEAATWFGKALAIEEDHLGSSHIRVSQTLRELGLCTRKV